mgnify:CR=1 FL=1
MEKNTHKRRRFCYNDKRKFITRSINVKKRISICILIILLASAFLPLGCSQSHGKGSEVCRQFLEYICEGSYGAAYNLLSPSVKNTTGSDTNPSDPMISAKEFTDKYTQIFNAVGLQEITYFVGNVSDASITSSIDFQMTYKTKTLGDMVNDYTINARYENGSWGVVWTPALIFPTMQWGDKLLIGINYPKRGEIFDAEGELLVKNLAPVTIFCVPSRIPDDKKDAVVKELLSIPQIKVNGEAQEDFEKRIREAVYSKNSSAVVAKLYPDQMDSTLEERFLSITGVGVDNSASLTSTRFRQYPYGRSACHLLGFAAVMWKEDWKRIDLINRRNDVISDVVNFMLGIADPTNNRVYEIEDDSNSVYQKDSWLGYAGLEQQYEEQLRGQKGGFAYIQGIDGSNRQTLYNIPALDGQDLHLTLDIRLQQRVEEVVQTIVYDESISGTVIVMNPRTGAVQALYSFPDYDVEAFSRGTVGTDAFTALEKDPQTPMLNRAIQGLYAPGSTFKTMTAIGALETGTLTTASIFPETEIIHNAKYKSTTGGYKDAWDVKKGEYAYTGIDEITRTGTSRRHTPMNMESSIIDSDNCFFSWAALRMGWEKLKDFLKYIGMGESVPFDLPTQHSKIKNDESEETYPLLAMTGYGQGELLVTPLQMACYIASFRNEGKAPVPYVVESIWQAEKNDYTETYHHETEIWKTMCSEKNADDLTQMMIGVCRERDGGTARTLGVHSYTIAGKTGTAEVGNKKDSASQADKEIAWFIGFRETNKDGSEVAPENERLVLVMLELDMSNLPEEYSQMKFLIGRALLKSDELTEPGAVETCFVGGTDTATGAN